MEKQFKNYTTFFDYNIGDDEENDFVTTYYYVKGESTTRYRRNRAAIRFLNGEEISLEEQRIIDSYFDGSINEIQRKQYKHCLLCTDKFQRKVLKELSEKYKFWEICFPTNPYTPGGMMIYLKDRENSHIENIGEISLDAFEELLQIIKELYSKLKNSLGNNQVVGINVLFNQISKTQKCIHGHIEPMIRDVFEWI